MVSVTKNEKARGAMLASSIGDALGWPNELNSGNRSRTTNPDGGFISWKRKNKAPFWHDEIIKKGEYSDDTQLILAVSRSLLFDDWKDVFTRVEYPLWLDYERGGGRSVKKAALIWKQGEIPWKKPKNINDYFMAGGNGGAMRILPHVIRNYSQDISLIMEDVIEDVIVSHGHPMAILGATCYAYALHYLFMNESVLSFAGLVEALIDGRKVWGAAPDRIRFSEWLEAAKKIEKYNYSEEWNNCYTCMVKELGYLKQVLQEGLLTDDKKALEDLGAYSEWGGAGDTSVLSAIYFFSKYANKPELAISIPANSKGIDTDTIASMTGGLVGAFCGDAWIPFEWRGVQDSEYISAVADDLLNGRIEKNKGSIKSKSPFEINNLNIVDKVDINSKYSILTISECRTSFGQTIYIKSVEKSENNILKDDDKTILSIYNNRIKSLINDDRIGRISFRKAMNAIILKSQGDDVDSISRKINLDKAIVKELVEAFFES